jgi:hypothetical protein
MMTDDTTEVNDENDRWISVSDPAFFAKPKSAANSIREQNTVSKYQSSNVLCCVRSRWHEKTPLQRVCVSKKREREKRKEKNVSIDGKLVFV